MSSGTESKTSANTSEQSFYEAEARQLLTLGSVEEIKRFLATTSGLNHALLSTALEQMAQKFSVAGKAAEARLAQFVQGILAAFIDQRGPPVAQPETIVTSKIWCRQRQPHRTRFKPCGFSKGTRSCSVQTRSRNFRVRYLISFAKRDRIHRRGRCVCCCAWLRLANCSTIPDEPRKARCSGERIVATRGACQALRRFARAEKIASGLDDPFLRISNLVGSASLYEQLDDNAKAADAYLKALELARESGNKQLTPQTAMKLAGCYRAMNRYSDALQLIDSALSAAADLAPVPEIRANHELRCRMYRGLLLEDLGRYDEGLGEYQQAARIAEAAGDRSRQFVALTNAAASQMKMRDYRKALRRFNEVLKTVEGWGNLVMTASTHNNIGNALLEMDRPADAREHFGKALSINLAAQSKDGEVIAYLGLAECAQRLGDREAVKGFHMLCLIPVLETESIELIAQYASHALGDEADEANEAIGWIEWAQQQAGERGKPFMICSCPRSSGTGMSAMGARRRPLRSSAKPSREAGARSPTRPPSFACKLPSPSS